MCGNYETWELQSSLSQVHWLVLVGQIVREMDWCIRILVQLALYKFKQAALSMFKANELTEEAHIVLAEQMA